MPVDVILYHKPVTFVRLAFLPIAILIMVNLYSQYYYATRVPPGNPHAVVEEIKREAPWMVERDGSEREPRGLLADGTWAGEKLRKCGRCLGPKPIVSIETTGECLHKYFLVTYKLCAADASLSRLPKLRPCHGPSLSL